MKMKQIILLLVVCAFLTTSCQLVPHTVDPGTWKGEARFISKKKQKYVLDKRVQEGRTKYRNRNVLDLDEDDELLAVIEDPDIEIIDDNGYKNGLACSIENQTRSYLAVHITDPHGHVFNFFLLPFDLMGEERKKAQEKILAYVEERSPEIAKTYQKEIAKDASFLSSQKTLYLEVGEHDVRANRLYSWSNRSQEGGKMMVTNEKLWHSLPYGHFFSGCIFDRDR